MARRAYEMVFQIGGNLASSFSSSFASASSRLSDLGQQSRQTQRALDQLGNKFRKGDITQRQYTESTERLTRELKQLENAQRRIRAISSTASKGFNTAKSVAGIAAIGTAATATGLAVSSVKKAMDFEEQLSTIKALTGATSHEMDQMKALALKLGQQTKYSGLEAAQGIEELLKAGLTPAAVQAGALEAGLNLATAGGLELASASQIMSTALNAYKADGLKASEVSDILAGTANSAATTVEELKYGLSQVSAVASGVGLSFKDTNKALGIFANNGLRGSDAGTSLKTMLSRLSPKTSDQFSVFDELGLMTFKTEKALKFLAKEGIKPVTNETKDVVNAFQSYIMKTIGAKKWTQSAEKVYRELGLSTGIVSSAFYDANGNLEDMSTIAGTLQEALKDLNSEQRQHAQYAMFGSDAIRAGNILFREGAEGINKFEREMSKVTALDVAKEKMDNATGAVEEMSGAFETLQIIAAESTLPIIKDVALGMADSFEASAPKVAKASKKISGNLREIFEPFAARKPELPKLEEAAINYHIPEGKGKSKKQKQLDAVETSIKLKLGPEAMSDMKRDISDLDNMQKRLASKIEPTALPGVAESARLSRNEEAMKQYEKDLDKHNKFKDYDFGDKVIYMLDEVTAKTGEWLEGSGGETMHQIFTKLGEIAAKAWLNAFTGAIKSTGTNLMEGNFGAATMTGIAAYLVGGGLLAKGAIGTGRWAYEKVQGRRGAGGARAGSRAVRSSPIPAPITTRANIVPNSLPPRSSRIQGTPRTSSAMSTAFKGSKTVLKKAAFPLMLGAEAYDIYKSNDKKKSVVESGGGLIGAAGGAKAGAVIGTMIAPGIGTVVGAFLGGLGGYSAGKFAAGKAVDASRVSAQPAPQATAQQNAPAVASTPAALDQPTAALKSALEKNVHNFNTLAMYSGQASGLVVGSFNGIKSSADRVISNLDILVSYTGQASGWLASLNGIQSAGQKVMDELDNLSKRIANIELPKSKRLSLDD